MTGNEASKAVDGDDTTYWASKASDYQWLYVDLGATYNINAVIVNWGSAYASDYRIQVSNSPYFWFAASTVFTRTGWTGGTDTITGLNARGRYVRIYALTRGVRNLTYGFSVREFQVYGN